MKLVILYRCSTCTTSPHIQLFSVLNSTCFPPPRSTPNFCVPVSPQVVSNSPKYYICLRLYFDVLPFPFVLSHTGKCSALYSITVGYTNASLHECDAPTFLFVLFRMSAPLFVFKSSISGNLCFALLLIPFSNVEFSPAVEPNYTPVGCLTYFRA